MNEHIKQLAVQAGLVRVGDWGMKRWEGPRSDSINDQDLEKFAELIVRECALVAKTLPHTPERHWVTDSVTYIPVHCEQNILKHFGVEE